MADETRNANVVLTANVDPYSQGMQQATKQTNALTDSINKLVASMDGITKRVGKKLLIFSAADAAAMTAYVAIAAKHEKQLTTIRAQTELTNKSYGNFKKGIDAVARSLPISGEAVIALTTQITKLGVTSEKQVMSMARTFTKLSAATGEDLGTLTAGLIELSRQMGTLGNGAEGIGKFADSLTTVSSQAGVSATSVLQFAQSIAPMARAAGIGQKEVLGISTAFTKAGADGFAAANAFNTMVTEIARATMNGSPAIGKYAETIGATVEQFNNMDPVERIVQLFEAVNKAGPDSVKVLDRLGIDGIRAAKSIQAVAAESGGLRKAIQDSMGAYGNGSTDKGAAAAFDSLDAQTTKLKNNMEQIASAIGDGILPVAKAFMAVMNGVLDAVNKVAGPLLSVAGAIGGLLAPVAASVGLLMSALGPLSSIMIAMTLFRLSPMRAMFQGFREGSAAAGAAKMGVPYLGPTTSAGQKLAAGNLPIYQRAPYLAAQRVGGLLPTTTGVSPFGQMALRTGIGTANAFTNWYAMPTQQLIANAAMRDPLNRVSYMGKALDDVYNKSSTMRGTLNQAFTNPMGYLAAMRASRAGGGVLPTQAAGAVQGGSAYGTSKVIKAEAEAREIAERKRMSALGTFDQRTIDRAGTKAYTDTMAAHEADQKAKAEAAKASGNNAAATNAESTAKKVHVRTMGEFNKAISGAAKSAAGIGVAYGKMGASLAAQSAATAGKSIFGMLGGMVGMGAGAGAAIAGVAALGLVVKTARDSTQSTFDPSRARNITNTNEALGVATEPVKDFASAIAEAAGATRKVTTALQGMTLTAGEVLAAQTREPVDKVFNNLRGPDQAVAYIKSMGELTGDQARSLAMDAISKFGPELGKLIRQQVMQQTGNLVNMGGNDIQGVLLQGAQETQKDTWVKGANSAVVGSIPFIGGMTKFGGAGAIFGGSPWMDEGSKEQINASVGAMYSEWSDNTKNFDKEVGGQTLATRLMEAGDQIFKDNSKEGKLVQDAFLKAVQANMLGGKELSVGMNPITGAATMNYHDINSGADFIREALAGNGEATERLSALLGGSSVTTSTSDAEKTLERMLSGENITPAERKIRQTRLGAFARENEDVKAATVGDKMGSPEDISKAVSAMTDEVTKNGTAFGESTVEINKLKSSITNIDSPLYQLATAAGTAATALGNINATRQGGSLGSLEKQGLDIIDQIQTGDYRTGPDLKTLQTQLQEVRLNRDQMVLEMAQATESMNIGVDRMNEDYQISTKNQWDDFRRQMKYSMIDFGISMKRAAEDAAKSMYDPFSRVVNMGASSAGGLLTNLKDQNRLFKTQMSQIKKLKKMGLSQQAIDQLQLMDPTKWAQVGELYDEFQMDHSLAGQFNAQTSKRGALAYQWTTSSENQTYTRSVEDRRRSTGRQRSEIEISQDRQVKSNQRTIDRMTEDWQKYRKDMVGDTKDVYKRMDDATRIALSNASLNVRTQVIQDTEFIAARLRALRGSLGDNTDTPTTPNTPVTGPGDINRDRTKWEDPALQRLAAAEEEARRNQSGPGYHPYANTGPSNPNDNPWGVNPDKVPWLAAGAYVGGPTLAGIAEHGDEFVWPLNGAQGHHAMATLAVGITKEMTKAYRVSGHSTPVQYRGQNGGTTITHTTNFQIAKIEAQDINDMTRQLKARAKKENLRKGANASIN